MKFHEKIGYIISETFKSPRKDSVVVTVHGGVCQDSCRFF